VKVLIIDDDEDLRNILEHHLKQEWPELQVEQFEPARARGMPDAAFPLGRIRRHPLDYIAWSRATACEWLRNSRSERLPACAVPDRRAGNEVIAVRADEGRRGRLPAQAGADAKEKLVELDARAQRAARSRRPCRPRSSRAPGGPELGRASRSGIKVLRLIGEGGMSRVYLASREGDDVPLVVKILRSEVTGDKKALERFLEEVHTGRPHSQPARGAHSRPRTSRGARLPGDGVLRRRRPEQARSTASRMSPKSAADLSRS
jgi:hypothetical protein